MAQRLSAAGVKAPILLPEDPGFDCAVQMQASRTTGPACRSWTGRSSGTRASDVTEFGRTARCGPSDAMEASAARKLDGTREFKPRKSSRRVSRPRIQVRVLTVGRFYALWCVNRMARDAKAHLERAIEAAPQRP